MSVDLKPGIVLALCLAAVLAYSLYAPVGFRGYDDLHYLQAAQAWVKNGVTVPDTHWAARLPYVLSLAAGIKLIGISDLALILPNAAMFIVILCCAFAITRQAGGSRAADMTAIAFTLTPFFFRMPTSYYPESMEVACGAAAIALALKALWAQPPVWRSRYGLLLGAGFIGGIGVVVRETAIALPLGLALLIFLRGRKNFKQAFADCAVLAIGYALPLILQSLFYLILTGDPLYRFKIDSKHILIPSEDLAGHVFTGGSPFFNWQLAALWSTRHSFHVHWTVNPILNLLFSWELFFLPWLALGAFLFRAKFSAKMRDVALLAVAVFATQYILNTFVIVIAPSVRYFGESIFLLALLGGFCLFAMGARLRLCAILAMLGPALFVATGQSSLPYAARAVEKFSLAHPGPLYVSPPANDRLYLAARHTPLLGSSLRTDAPPIGGTRVLMFEDFTFGSGTLPEAAILAETCAGGRPEWDIVENDARPSLYWTALEKLGLVRFVPQGLAMQLRRDYEHAIFVRRGC